MIDMPKFFYAFVLTLPLLAQAADTTGDTELWEALAEGGHVALMRHALAPGTGDPAEFTLGDCATQRNLSARGREQARRIGQAFRDHGVPVGAVLSSEWCRCLDTAAELDLGPVKPFPALNSFFRDRSRGPQQTQELRQFIAQWAETDEAADGVVVMVTHQVNVTALTDVYPSSGEIVVLRPEPGGGFAVLGTLLVDG